MAIDTQNTTHAEKPSPDKSGFDFYSSILLLILGAYILFEAVSMPSFGQSGEWWKYNTPGLTPMSLSIALIILSGFQSWKNRRYRKNITTSLSPEARRVFLIFGFLFGYVLTVYIFGFLAPTFLIVALFYIAFAETQPLVKRISIGLLCATVVLCTLWYVFGVIFLVPLPEPIWLQAT